MIVIESKRENRKYQAGSHLLRPHFYSHGPGAGAGEGHLVPSAYQCDQEKEGECHLLDKIMVLNILTCQMSIRR